MMNMKIITVGCVKGGTAKTTTSIALAQEAARRHLKVLLIDADMQGNATTLTGADRRRAGLYDVLDGRISIAEAAQHTRHGIDVVAGSVDLMAVKTKSGSATRLHKVLVPVKEEYDLCIIDTPPAVGEMLFEAVSAADLLLVCVHSDISSLAGLYSIEDIAAQLRPEDPVPVRTVITEFEGRANVDKDTRDDIIRIASEDGAPVIGIIRKGADIRKAQRYGVSLFDLAPNGRPASDYVDLYNALMEV